LGIFGQLYASGGGPIGTEFQVNTYTTGTQKNASVGVTNGTFLVAWESDQGISNNDIFAQRYDSGGAALGTEFQVNTYTTSYQHSVAVAGGGTGSFVIVWDSFMQDGSYGSVFGQRYDSNGTAVGTEFQVNTYTTSTFPGRFPSVAVAPNGGFVVAWNNDADQDGSGDGVFAQRYDSTGSPQGTEFQVNTFTTGGQFRSSVATTDDDFVIVWDGFDQDGSGLGVFARRFASTGSAIGTDFQVNTGTFNTQGYNAIAFTNGDFIVLWHDDGGQDGDLSGIRAQRYALSDPVAPDCALVPLPNCTDPGKASLLIKDANADGASADDRLTWKWIKGPLTTQGDFGEPTVTADYHLCIYSGGAPTLTIQAILPAAGTCGDQPCWKTAGTKGYKRKDSAATIDGISLVVLKGGPAGKSKIVVKGKDGNLFLSPPTLPFPNLNDVVVQLSNTDNTNCWESTFSPASFKKNTDWDFKAKAP
jgi:hypothetical protein